jgi:hypothetical protein
MGKPSSVGNERWGPPKREAEASPTIAKARADAQKRIFMAVVRRESFRRFQIEQDAIACYCFLCAPPVGMWSKATERKTKTRTKSRTQTSTSMLLGQLVCERLYVPVKPKHDKFIKR